MGVLHGSLLYVFLGEIAFQGKIALRSAENLFAIQDLLDSVEVWRSIQSILVAAANISKILWPEKARAAGGKHLRTLLGIEADNVLACRKIRNHLEHYDDRIEQWFEDTLSAVYTDLAIDSQPWIWGPKLDTRHRVYNPVTRVLTFRGESVDLGEVVTTIADIHQNCGRFVLT